MCYTELFVDWLPRGGHQYILTRGCAPLTQTWPEGRCDERSSTSLQFKDCMITCNTNNCNTDFDSIASLFDAGTNAVSSCYECGHYHVTDGDDQGQLACFESILPSNNNYIKTVECPKYADAGCTTAGSVHKLSTAFYTQEEYRSCSPFTDVSSCYATEINGLDHESCKSTCDTNNCNISKIQRRQQCFTCTSVKGTSGWPSDWTSGTGDKRCWDETLIDETMLAECNYDEQYCGVEVTVQFMGSGNQEATITRGCRKKAVNEKEDLRFYVQGVCKTV